MPVGQAVAGAAVGLLPGPRTLGARRHRPGLFGAEPAAGSAAARNLARTTTRCLGNSATAPRRSRISGKEAGSISRPARHEGYDNAEGGQQGEALKRPCIA